MHIVTVAEMRELEAQADHQYGLTSPILMNNAGKSAADIFEHHLAPHHSMSRLEILFLIGPGNNGGDGMVMAKHLERSGAIVHHYHWKEHKLIANGQALSPADTETGLEALLQSADYIIDALLATGRSRPLPEDMPRFLPRVRREQNHPPQLPVVAIHFPPHPTP